MEEALASFRRAGELAPPGSPIAQEMSTLLPQLEKQIALSGRLPAILRGEDKPKDNLERLTVAQLAYDRKNYAAGIRLWAEAFEADPACASDLKTGNRYNAACTAALAGAGQGKDNPPPDEAARRSCRTQARGWLRADLGLWSKQLDTGKAQDRAAVTATLSHWKQDTDLASIRDAEALAKLPEAERKEWQALWADVDSLLERAQGPKS